LNPINSVTELGIVPPWSQRGVPQKLGHKVVQIYLSYCGLLQSRSGTRSRKNRESAGFALKSRWEGKDACR
jgi:hypothetical protein